MPQSQLNTLIILTPGFPANEEDSTCIPPQQLFVKALKEVNPELNIIVLTFQYPFFSGEYLWNGIKIIAFGNPQNSRLKRLFTGLRMHLTLKKLYNTYGNISLMSFWLGKCAFIGNNFALKYKLTHYCWLLGQDARAGNRYFNKVKPTGESLIALSDFIAREFTQNYGITPQHIIPVGIDTSLFNSDSHQRDIDILGTGSLIPLKQYALFIETIKSLKELFPNIKAMICGDGPQMQQLLVMTRDMHLEDNIILTGRLAHKEVLATMQRTKIFLHTSGYEGFGAVCAEALYAGAQVVSLVKPMDIDIPHWHIAADKADMVKLLQTILLDTHRDHQSVLPYSIQANAREALKLFNYSEPAIS